MTEQQKLERAKIKNVTDMVNVLGGLFAAFCVAAFFLPMVDYSKGFWDYLPQLFMVAVGTCISGAVFAGLINYLQGAMHQKASESNNEEKRSGKASIWACAGICSVLPFFQFKDSTILWIAAAVCVITALVLWQSVKPKKKK